jgi:hypothetical protein
MDITESFLEFPLFEVDPSHVLLKSEIGVSLMLLSLLIVSLSLLELALFFKQIAYFDVGVYFSLFSHVLSLH